MAKHQIEQLPQPEVKAASTKMPEVKTNGEAAPEVEIKEVIIAVPFGELPEHAYEMVHLNVQLPRPLAKVSRRMTKGLADKHEMVGDRYINRRDWGKAVQWLLTKVSEG